MLQTFRELLPFMAADLPRCPENEMLQQLRVAWYEFCERTGAWRPIVTQNLLTAKYQPITPPAKADIKKVLKVWIPSAAEVAAGQAGAELHPARYRVARYPGGVRLELNYVPAEAVTKGLVLHVVLSPEPDVKECEAPTILNDYYQALVGRAVYKLALRPRRPWSSITVAGEANRSWLNGLSLALRDTLTVRKGDQACVRQG